METRAAVIAIIVKDNESAGEINSLLHEYCDFVIGRMGIPYRYEYPLKIRKSSSVTKTFYPDFLCLNLRTRQEFFWEHFGLMSSSEYAGNAAGKLVLYANNGFYPGKNLIITFESDEGKFDTQIIEKMIQTYLI